MIEELKKELRDLASQVERKKKLESMLESLRREERELSERAEELMALLCEEEADVERLSKTSLTSLLYSLLGKKETMLDKEQREAYAARLKYEAAASLKKDCRDRIRSLSREREGILDCERRYNEVKDKLTELLGCDLRYAEPICRFQRGLGEKDSRLRELSEAIAAGNEVMSLLERIEGNLDDARDVACFDLFGGGLFADMEKHSLLDEAQANAQLMQALMSRFRTELADLSFNPQLGKLNIDGFLRFADFFFDGFFADLSVLDHINESIENVQNIKWQVGGLMDKLKSMMAYEVREKAELLQKMSEFIMEA